jgi:hypothetical protein
MEFSPARLDYRTGVWKGEPRRLSDGKPTFEVPNEPHVFCGRLILKEGNVMTKPAPATILVGHGCRNERREWVFGDGRLVTDVVRDYTRQNLQESIEFVAVCNSKGVIGQPEMPHVIHALGSSVSMKVSLEANEPFIIAVLDDAQNGAFYVPEGLKRLAVRAGTFT